MFGLTPYNRKNNGIAPREMFGMLAEVYLKIFSMIRFLEGLFQPQLRLKPIYVRTKRNM